MRTGWYSRSLAALTFGLAGLMAGCGSVTPNQPGPDAHVWLDAALPECQQGQTTCIDGDFNWCVLGEWSVLKECEGPCDPHDGCEGDIPQPDGLSFIWVANTGEGTVSKINTVDEVEVGRFYTCPDTYCDPSRTSVNLYGDAVVTNRDMWPSSVTKFAANEDDCIDRNGNGTIDTSGGPSDVRPWGQDECMLWNTPLPMSGGQSNHGARGTAWDGEEDPRTGEGGHVWVGTCTWMDQEANYVYKINGDSGEIDDFVIVPGLTCSYGGAVDGFGNFWILDPWGMSGGTLYRIEMATMWWDTAAIACGYGITVDSFGRVWSGGNMNCVSRWDPVLEVEDVADLPSAQFPRGIAVGLEKSAGYAWQVDSYGSLIKIDEDTMAVAATYPIGMPDTIGVAVDYEGYVWVVSQGASQVYKFDPDTETYVTISVGMGPYTYSDMTGVQLRNVVPVD
ncbi:MAG: hypothetical protein ABI333_00285 [bacterium]